MAAQNLTTAALVAVQRRLNELIAGGGLTALPRYEPSNVLRALGARNGGTNTRLLRDNAGMCTSLEVHWLKKSTTNAAVTTTMPAIACTQAATDGIISDKKTYVPNLFVNSTRLVDDDLCGTLFKAPDRPESARGGEVFANALLDMMQDNRAKIDEEIISRLHTNRQTVNNDPNGSTTAWITFNATTDQFEIDDTARFYNPDSLTDIDVLIQNQGIGSYFLVGGRYAFYNAAVNAQYRVENDNERFMRRYGTVDMAHDVYRMDSKLNTLLSASNQTYMFGVANGSYVMANFSYFNDVPEQLEMQTLTTFTFRVPDPVVTIVQDGRVQPLYHDVIHKTICGGTDGRGMPTVVHELVMTTKMLWEPAPTETTGLTGLLEFAAPVSV